MIDLKVIKNQLTEDNIKEILAQIGADEYRETTEAIIFKTVCHHCKENLEDASFKLYYYKNTKTFHCYTHCGDSFDIYELLKRNYEISQIQYDFFKDIVLKVSKNPQIDNLNDFYQIYESPYEKYRKRNVEINLTIINESILNIFSIFYTPEWLRDGISERAMSTFNIKYSIPMNKIIIPHYNIDGKLIGIRGRALNEKDIQIGKYMPIQIGETIYSHPLGYNLYGLNLNKENIKNKKMAFIFESEKAVLQYETMFGRENNIAVAVCGSSISSYQFDLLNQLGVEKIIIAFDKEGQTWDEKEKYYNKLQNLCRKNNKRCLMGFIYDLNNLLKLKESPTDRGKEIFKELYNKGVVWVK